MYNLHDRNRIGTRPYWLWYGTYIYNYIYMY